MGFGRYTTILGRGFGFLSTVAPDTCLTSPVLEVGSLRPLAGGPRRPPTKEVPAPREGRNRGRLGDQLRRPVVWPTSMRCPSGSRMYARISRP